MKSYLTALAFSIVLAGAASAAHAQSAYTQLQKTAMAVTWTLEELGSGRRDQAVFQSTKLGLAACGVIRAQGYTCTNTRDPEEYTTEDMVDLMIQGGLIGIDDRTQENQTALQDSLETM